MIRSEDGFRDLLDLERLRARRRGHPVALMSFASDDPGLSDGWSRLLTAGGRGALRATDAIGRLGSLEIGVLLPFTDAEDARLLCNRLQKALGADSGATSVRVQLLEAERSPEESKCRMAPGVQGEVLGEEDDRDAGVVCAPAGVIGLLARSQPRWKRGMDIVAALTGLVILAPMIALVAVAVKLTSRGPVLFRQRRTGVALSRFTIYKFRTMRLGAEKQVHKLGHLNQMSGPLFKADSDPRLTPIGAFLRRTSLDEFPQLVNVLKGEMSLLGPRALSPPPASYEPWQLKRFLVTPGVACRWQASRRMETDFDEWMRSDLAYVNARPSLLGDLRLLLATIRAVLRCAGGR